MNKGDITAVTKDQLLIEKIVKRQLKKQFKKIMSYFIKDGENIPTVFNSNLRQTTDKQMRKIWTVLGGDWFEMRKLKQTKSSPT